MIGESDAIITEHLGELKAIRSDISDARAEIAATKAELSYLLSREEWLVIGSVHRDCVAIWDLGFSCPSLIPQS